MADKSKIEWCDSTFNPWIGCTKVSPACAHCYAEVSTPARVHQVQWGSEKSRYRTKTWGDPVRWNKQTFCECMSCGWRGESRACSTVSSPAGFYPPVDAASACPTCMRPTIKSARRRVFCASLADVFDNEVPDEWREDLFDLIRVTPNLDWLLLTKRPQNIRRMVELQGAIAGNGNRYLPANVWLGTTVCDQEEANRNVPVLLRTKDMLGAKVLFVSVEPMLGPIDLTQIPIPQSGSGTEFDPITTMNVLSRALPTLPVLDWVIAGGESGAHARPSHPEWFAALRDQCKAAQVPFLFKQWGEWAPDNLLTYAQRLQMLESINDPVYVKLSGTTHGIDAEDHTEFAASDILMHRVGKKTAGRVLDGKEHNGFPEGGL